VSELDVPLLVRRTRLLLRAYPRAYRAHRGEEILDTLLETTRPGHGWPPAREVVSVIGGGLRARRAANLSQGLGTSLRHVGILAAALMMLSVPGELLFCAAEQVSTQLASMERGVELAAVPGSILAVLALAAAWWGRRWLVAAAVVPVIPAAVICERLPVGQAHASVGWGLVVAFLAFSGVPALAVLVPLTRRAERPPVSLLWLLCVPLAAELAGGLASKINTRLPINGVGWVSLAAPYITYLSLATVVVAVCWTVTDVRPLAAVAVQFLLCRVLETALDLYGRGASGSQNAIAIALPLALTCALVWLLRHRARTAPPTIG
jgi:hypothetical protein